MARIPESVIEEIKYRNNIEEVIGSYVTLKRAGSNLVGLCPFHSEKSPSFTVFSGQRSFYCFGCGAGGDVISFVMRAQNLPYLDAVQTLAKRAGITLPETAEEAAAGTSRKRFYQMNRDAAKFFYNELQKSETAQNYLKKRALPTSLCRHFGLGHAPAEFFALTNHMKKLGYTDEELIEGFLCGRSKKSGRPFDLFRDRIMIPIIDNAGEIIAFGGRIVGEGTPKYLNSSDTPVFKKSRNLYALNFAKSYATDGLILCEGYMDVIALHGAGFTQAVATLGTAITPEQARIMARYTKKVYISYDSDAAGQRAAEKAFRLLGEVGLETKIINMQGAKDPDEYIKKFGAERFKRLLEAGRTAFDFKLDNVLAAHDIKVDGERIKAANELTSYISGIHSTVEREIYIRRTAEKLGLPAEALKADVERTVKRRISQQKRENDRKLMLESQGVGDRVNPDYMKNVKGARSEEAILGMVLLQPEWLMKIHGAVAGTPFALTGDDFVTSFGRKVFENALERCAASENPTHYDYGTLAEVLTVEEMGRVQRMVLRRRELKENSERVLIDCIAALKAEKAKGSGEDALSDIADILKGKREKR